MKEKLFSVTRKDFDIQTFRSGGKGGQHQNKTDSGVRIIHRESGAIGESREERSQHQNKKIALRKLANNDRFKSWVKLKASKLAKVEEMVDKEMQLENLKIEVREDGKWRKESSQSRE